jgi:hypothetical protein
MNRFVILLAVPLLSCVAAPSDVTTDGSSIAFSRRPLPDVVGRPFGPFGFWSGCCTPQPNTPYFSSSRQVVDPSQLIDRINAARSLAHRLVIVMTGGADTIYKSNGVFDPAKWKLRQSLFDTPELRAAVAQAVDDSTIVGDILIDEPERETWGGTITKAVLDDLAAYTKAIFPSLPVGPSFGVGAYLTFDPSQTYSVVDFTYHQYSWNFSTTGIAKGDVAAWRDAEIARAQTDGVALALGLNVLNGGIRDNDNDGVWECPSTTTEGQGTYYPNCRMTDDQVRKYGKKILPAACFVLLWRYDVTYMSRPDNQKAFYDVASTARSLPPIGCAL